MNRDMLIRMVADILLPVGERQGMIDSLYSFFNDAQQAKESLTQALVDIETIKQGVALLSVSAITDAPIIEAIQDSAEIAATESAIAADNTDELLDVTPEV